MDKALHLLDHMLAATTPGAVAGLPTAGSPTATGQPETTPSTGVRDANAPNAMKPASSGGGGESGGPLPPWDPRLPLSRPDAISFGTVIDGCSRARMADEAVELLTKMRQERIGGACVGRVERTATPGGADSGGSSDVGDGGSGGFLLPPNVHCVTAAITACGRANRPENAVAVLQEAVALEDAWLEQLARQRRRRPRKKGGGQDQRQGDEESSALAAAPVAVAAPLASATLATAADGPAALDRRQQRRPGGEEQTPATILKGAGGLAAEASTTTAAAVGAAAAATDVGGKVVQENAAVTGSRPAGAAEAAAIATLEPSPPVGGDPGGGTKGSTRAAATTSETLFSAALRPAYNAAINACLGAGRNGQARALMRNMRERRLRPGREIFNSLLVACSDSFEV